MRSRNIKVGFFRNEELVEVSPLGRLLFIGLWCMADRKGLLEDRPKKIKLEIIPYDDVDCNKLLQELYDHGLIIRYSVNGKNYIAIPKFLKHQRPHQNEKSSELPSPKLATKATSTCDQGLPQSALNPDVLNPDVLNPEKRVKTAKVTAKKTSLPKKTGDATAFPQKAGEKTEKPEPFYLTKKKKKLKGWKLETFELFWKTFNWKKDKANASDAWLQTPGLTQELAIKQIIPAAEYENNNRQSLLQKGRTPKWAQGWLSGRRWEDEKFNEEFDEWAAFRKRREAELKK